MIYKTKTYNELHSNGMHTCVVWFHRHLTAAVEVVVSAALKSEERLHLMRWSSQFVYLQFLPQ